MPLSHLFRQGLFWKKRKGRSLSPPYLSSVRFLQQSLPVPKQRKKSLEGFPLHVNCILNGPAEIVYFISSRPTSYSQYQFLSADKIGKNHPRPGWFELRHAFSSFFLENTPNKGCIVTFLRPAFSTATFCHQITLNILKHPNCNVLFTMLRMWGMSRFPPTDAFH